MCWGANAVQKTQCEWTHYMGGRTKIVSSTVLQKFLAKDTTHLEGKEYSVADGDVILFYVSP